MKLFIKLTLLVMCFYLQACVTTKEVPLSSVSDSFSKKDPKLTIFKFNQLLEKALNEQDTEFLKQQLNIKAINKKIHLKHPYLLNTQNKAYKLSNTLATNYLSALMGVSNLFTWQYLFSTTDIDGDYIAHYRLNSDEGYNYLDIYLTHDDFKIVDQHSLSFEYSAIDFVYQISELMLNTARDKELQHEVKSLKELFSAIKKGDFDTFQSIYKELDSSLKKELVIGEFLLRMMGKLPAIQAQLFWPEVVKFYEKINKDSLSFEGHYFEKKNYMKAIKSIFTLPEHALQDSKMQSELALLYAYEKSFERSYAAATNAIIAEPYNTEAFIVLLQVSFISKNYAISLDVIDVLNAKFNFKMTEEEIKTLEEASGFLTSEVYATWLSNQVSS
ncbi:hypothetical protein [Pseudoalteromonas denitrificans]|uniref:Uncharacterized protein n=1 Tax=Pseudoalteromonas denitrificans DSM 6059 TaxID=1123010 RepID=A0A1I1PZC8_9GAMM|nr:hypothetical protein [Pseudoalteromonas denitrificans]SFD15095.1 hypothetical protein SAMN02745724_03677 [Pseudoalteromonas denitrificans DSM 6059]